MYLCRNPLIPVLSCDASDRTGNLQKTSRNIVNRELKGLLSLGSQQAQAGKEYAHASPWFAGFLVIHRTKTWKKWRDTTYINLQLEVPKGIERFHSPSPLPNGRWCQATQKQWSSEAQASKRWRRRGLLVPLPWLLFGARRANGLSQIMIQLFS